MPASLPLTKLDSLMSSIYKRIGFGGVIVIIEVMYATSILLCVFDGSDVDEFFQFFQTHWSNAKRFLRGIWTRKVYWRNLPPELWGEIGKRMVNRLEIVSFRSVCKKWRSSLPTPTGRFPLLLPPPPSCDPEFQDMPYAINELTIYLQGIDRPAMQVDQGGIFTLTFYSYKGDKAEYDKAALLAPPVRLLRTFNSLSYLFFHLRRNYKDKREHGKPPLLMNHLSFLAKVYYPCKALDSREIRADRECTKFPKKLVLICSPNAAGVDPNYARMCDLSVVARLGGEMKGRLALLRLGGSPQDWVWDTDFCTQVFVNIATYKGRLCTLDHLGRVFLMDYDSLKLTMVCAPSSVPPELEHMSLFENCGDLYLIDFKRTGGLGLTEAYMLSLSSQMWIKVEEFKFISGLTYVSSFLF